MKLKFGSRFLRYPYHNHTCNSQAPLGYPQKKDTRASRCQSGSAGSMPTSPPYQVTRMLWIITSFRRAEESYVAVGTPCCRPLVAELDVAISALHGKRFATDHAQRQLELLHYAFLPLLHLHSMTCQSGYSTSRYGVASKYWPHWNVFGVGI